MKILMVLASGFPPDSRVEKEAISLSENGHEVHLLCYSSGKAPSQQETKYFTVHRVNFTRFYRKKLSALALVLPFYFGKWKQSIKALRLKYEFDAIHIHDLPLSKVGYYFKKNFNCKFICDQHEFYSDWIKDSAHMNTFLGKIISKLSDWEEYEKKYLELADLVITVAEPLRNSYLEKYNIGGNRIITIPNTPSRKIYSKNNVIGEIVEAYKKDFIVFYAGGIDILRGIDTAIIALKEIRRIIPNAKLLICGKIVKPYDPFKTAGLYGVSDLLLFKGWVDEQELPSYIAASNVCFFTPPAHRDEINKTIATKIFQYAIMGRPIIVSDARMMKEFVEQNNLGVSIKSGDYEAFAENVIKFHNNEINFQPQSFADFTWEETVSPLLRKYKDFM